MGFWRSPLGAVCLLFITGVVGLLGFTLVQVHRETSPDRQAPVVDFEAMRVTVEDVEFPATDGVRLRGWMIRGRPGAPAVILCHDAGLSKASLLSVAMALRGAGFTLLLFDFRGHGDSGAGRSTLGLHEKREILGAVDFLAGLEGVDQRRIGIYGVGMGAHAAVLAAQDRPNLRVLVLDGLYPDVGYRLTAGVFDSWRFAVDHFSFLARGMFAVLCGTTPRSEPASEAIGTLLGRDLLLLAPAADAGLTSEMQRLYERIPEQADVDGNLVVLPATHGDGLYGDHLTRYQQRVTDFFVARLDR